MKQFISVDDVGDIPALVGQAMAYKRHPRKDIGLGAGKRIGLLFMNPSLRTRISTQLAAANLGMECIVFNVDKEGWKLELEEGALMNGSSVEHIKDAAPVLGAYFDILCVRTFPALRDRNEDYAELFLKQLIEHSGIPVVSMESATLHPLQSLADLMTIIERIKEEQRPKIVLSWAPHVKPLPQCVANSFAQWINAWGGYSEFVITHPAGYELHESFTGNARMMYDQREALRDADFVYVKNWSSYYDYGGMKAGLDEWMLTPGHLNNNKNTNIMHCLPVRRNVELSDALLDSRLSIVTEQAANRVWAAQAVFSSILKEQL